jgi:hypothetical protein
MTRYSPGHTSFLQVIIILAMLCYESVLGYSVTAHNSTEITQLTTPTITTFNLSYLKQKWKRKS